MNFKNFIKNALAIDDKLDENEKRFLNTLAEKIKKRKLSEILSIFCEAMQPVGFVTSQFSYMSKAFLVPVILSNDEFDFFIRLIAKRKGWEYFSEKLKTEK